MLKISTALGGGTPERRRRLELLFVAVLLAACPAIAGSANKKSAPAATGSPMLYFRASSPSTCNVYMNYSYVDDPKFQLRVMNPYILTSAESAFVAQFNAQFATMIRRRPDACDYVNNPAVARLTQDAILQGCLEQERAMGYGEGSWSGGRLPAPSNCISYRDSPPGAVDLLPGNLPAPRMSIEGWMSKAASGR